ncbi:hypothetical protein JN531_017205 (plasmid) [Flagellatimonas centrodinii]|uniref:hypothetical protein n=1 Tax=Flagellatimonas centrodinii TaxID=2806210 RepID=UPI001FEE6EE1|nr:hypothetical protein [Flagellatimonas centrodinii]ULQ48371.1 hypothetical protein JN531_017205 [Flagellatimonas centrodinii]
MRKRDPIKLLVVISGGVVQSVAFDTENEALPTMEVRVIDYDTPAGLPVVDVEQGSGGTAPAATYSVGASLGAVGFLPLWSQVDAAITAASVKSGATRLPAPQLAVNMATGECDVLADPEDESLSSRDLVRLDPPPRRAEGPAEDDQRECPPLSCYEEDMARAA